MLIDGRSGGCAKAPPPANFLHASGMRHKTRTSRMNRKKWEPSENLPYHLQEGMGRGNWSGKQTSHGYPFQTAVDRAVPGTMTDSPRSGTIPAMAPGSCALWGEDPIAHRDNLVDKAEVSDHRNICGWLRSE